jgi:hypothetical protein
MFSLDIGKLTFVNLCLKLVNLRRIFINKRFDVARDYRGVLIEFVEEELYFA